ncbi:phosphate transport system regulatory protein PhoU [Lysobacteraceae bacterium NML120232]|nr:phosphate transport system regulatory protein PhoU [Xanthomonadaceae bacterium NML08-0793]PJK13780.1 phosphate transport system regulatory protein PhoU [Xanthomonadaceae bacterium NML120232]
MNQEHNHIVQSYDEEQQRLGEEIQRMGAMAIAQLEAALDAVERRDDQLARHVIANDAAIDRLEEDISQGVMKLALRGPLASDLRVILAALRIAAAIERAGDYAANLAKRALVLNTYLPMPQIPALRQLGLRVAGQMRDVLRAYAALDAEAAQQVRERDAEIDTLHTRLFHEITQYMTQDARHIQPCTHLLFMAKNLERIGDHATNIAEHIWYRARPATPLSPREKRDRSSELAPR